MASSYDTILAQTNPQALASHSSYAPLSSGGVPIVNATPKQNPANLNTTKDLQSALKVGAISHDEFIQRFNKLNSVGSVTKNTTKGFSPKNLAKAITDVGVGSARFIPRAAAELGTTAYNVAAPHVGLPQQTLNPSQLGRPGTLLLGKEPISATTTQGINAAVTHPGGFHIKGTPITLSPTQTGIGETVGKTLLDALALKGGVDSVDKTVTKAKTEINNAKTTLANAQTQGLLQKLNEAKTPEVISKPISGDIPVQAPSPALLKTPVKTPTPVSEPIKPGQGSAGEEGMVNPGAAVKDAKALIEKHQQSVKYSGDINRFASSSEGAKGNLLNDSAKLIKGRQQLTSADRQTLQDYRDAKMQGQTPAPLPDHLKAVDQQATDFAKAKIQTDAERARLEGNLEKAKTIESQNPETYTHRVAQGKGSAFDYVIQNDRKNPLSVGLGKSTPADKARVFHAITDEQGNRRVVAIKSRTLKTAAGQKIGQGKLVTAISKDKTENLGKLKLKTDEVRMQKELEPIQHQIDNLEKEKRILSKVKAKGGVSKARVQSLNRKAIKAFNKQGDTPLPRNVRRQANRSLKESILKVDELNKVKTPYTNAPGRLETLNKRLLDAHRQYSDVLNKYDINDLENKTFVGKDGKKYTIGQASQSEITKATGQKYYVDPYLTNHAAYLDSRVALENVRMFDAIKKSPLSDKFMSAPEQTAPKGWKSVSGLDQFRGYKFEPRTADALHDVFVRNKGQTDLLNQVGHVLRNSIVYFPVKHDFNIASSYVIDRGLSGLARPIPALKSIYQATQDVAHNTPFYQELAKKGFELTTNDKQAFEKVFSKELNKLVENKSEIEKISKALGNVNPVRLYKAIQRVSVWDVQDIANIARVRERMAPGLFKKGMSMEDAIKQTERFTFQYKVPERVAGTRAGSQLLQSNKVFFGRYRYDQYKILGNIMKDSLKVTNPKQATEAWDKMAALLVGSLVAWPLVNKGVQAVTGNPNANIKAPGPMELPETINKVREGKQSGRQAAANQVYLSSGLTVPVDIAQNRDPFTGKNIVDDNATKKEQGKQLVSWVKTQIPPIQTTSRTANAPGNKLVSTLLAISGTSMPKNSPLANKLNSLKFDTLPTVQKQAKAAGASGDLAKAMQVINQYNESVLQSAKEDLRDKGVQVPDNKTLIGQLKKSGFYYQPRQSTINGWSRPKPAKLGGFTP